MEVSSIAHSAGEGREREREGEREKRERRTREKGLLKRGLEDRSQLYAVCKMEEEESCEDRARVIIL